MKEREALTIVASLCADGVLDKKEEAILRKALAQPEQEPVAWEAPQGYGIKRFISQSLYNNFAPEIRRWYRPFKCSSCEVTPPQRQPLTDELVNTLYQNLEADERTKQFTAQNWFQAGLSTGESAHGKE